MTRLVRVHDEMGERCFEEAAHRALVTIARTVQIEAGRTVDNKGPVQQEQTVVRFPLDAGVRDDRLSKAP